MIKNRSIFLKLKWIFFIFLSLTIISQQVVAGALDDFEDDATLKRNEYEKKKKDSRDYDSDSSHGECFGDNACIDLFGRVIIFCGALSWQRVKPDQLPDLSLFNDDIENIKHRKTGEFLIPFVRLDTSYQNVESDVDAFDYRVELGYGPFGIQTRQPRYREEDTSDELDIYQTHALYRMSIGNNVEIDLGLGQFAIEGNKKNSGPSFTMPIIFHYNEYMGIEFRPVWANINENNIKDYDLALLCGWRYISVRVGYRWLESENQSLNGPFIGLSTSL